VNVLNSKQESWKTSCKG